MGDTAILVGLILLIWFLVIPGLYIFWGRRKTRECSDSVECFRGRVRAVLAATAARHTQLCMDAADPVDH